MGRSESVGRTRQRNQLRISGLKDRHVDLPIQNQFITIKSKDQRKLDMKTIGIILLIVLGLFILSQLVPYGRNHNNPPVVAEPQWDSPQTRALAVRACFDCHSNDTNWPWYSNIAPISWLTQRDVDEGRQRLNFSEWGQRDHETDDIFRMINNGEMPPSQYRLMHPKARLNESEKQQLIQGLQATLGQ